MIYSLTDKLKFEESPKIEIKEHYFVVRDDAETVLKLMDLVETEGETAAALKAVDLLFSKADKKKLESLHLNMADYTQVISTAMQLAVGADPDEEVEEQ